MASKLNELKFQILIDKVEKIKEQIKEAEGNHDINAQYKLMKELIPLQKELLSLRKT